MDGRTVCWLSWGGLLCPDVSSNSAVLGPCSGPGCVTGPEMRCDRKGTRRTRFESLRLTRPCCPAVPRGNNDNSHLGGCLEFQTRSFWRSRSGTAAAKRASPRTSRIKGFNHLQDQKSTAHVSSTLRLLHHTVMFSLFSQHTGTLNISSFSSFSGYLFFPPRG